MNFSAEGAEGYVSYLLSSFSFEKVVGGLNDACEQINKDRKPLPVSFAYGCCDSRDSSLKSSAHTKELVDEVFKVADERMYACKAEMKKSAKAENR